MKTNDGGLINKYAKKAEKILSKAEEFKELDDKALCAKTNEFLEKLENGETLEDIIIDAFAVARESARRKTGLEAYKVQIIGGLILHDGNVAEMKTGEGKTLTALMPTYLNALSKKGVHVVTVNEYLSERDSKINGEVLEWLGLTVGLNKRSHTPLQKKKAFEQDVTYTTNSELGFDYLRDNMVDNLNKKVLRELNYCIIDETDSILIDESRTPLIISGKRSSRTPQYVAANILMDQLNKNEDIEIDEESRQVFLTPSGVEKAEKHFMTKNLFHISNTEIYHVILNAARARFVFKAGVEYIVNKKQEIVLIDQNTGRLMEGRSYSGGLQQAIQAKEKVNIEPETLIVATITYQNFFRLYSKLSGMTGTAKTEEEEFIKIYNMQVISVPTNKPIIRKDEIDFVFANNNAKLKYLINEIKQKNEIGQPILIGTTSVESSEQVANFLSAENLKYEILNAKNHEREAEIIAHAGEKNSITLATNMAGRGTDIKLGKGVKEIGGLVVFGVERNESRRIDNQLRGRSGRQGDPGTSRFFVSVDDQLLVRFGGPKIQRLFSKLGDDFIRSKMLMRSISGAQKKIEGMNFDQRKNLLDYDNVLAQHRETIYAQRDQILKAQELEGMLDKMQYSVSYDLTNIFGYELHSEWFVDYKKIKKGLEGKIVEKNSILENNIKNNNQKQIALFLKEKINDFYINKTQNIDKEILDKIVQKIMIISIDKFWQTHIDAMQQLRSGIHLQSYAQKDPLHTYVEESKQLYDYMKIQIAHEVIIGLANLSVSKIENFDKKEAEEVQLKTMA
ncbi:preprotein translocase subunit SecA [Spiroplasma endosymbiont of Amphibalanus improvisus]|uniref:preprotein translocase subunit SecA n=1 Tax=Spiroplasma endosymbiont of Amphibalanus improvisus TaxID=3066327 RepID=UPI00313EC1DE